jgi:type IV pilus assembly protein PilY1
MVALGTGSYFRTDDQTDETIQSLYGVRDSKVGASTYTRADLLRQEITSQSVADFDGYVHKIRIISNHSYDTSTPEKGWYIDLDRMVGERVVSEVKQVPGANGSRAHFTMLVPDEDPCGSGRDGYFCDIDMTSGGRTDDPVFDLNFDREFNASDTVSGDGIAVSCTALGRGENVTVLRVPGKPYAPLIPGDPWNPGFSRPHPQVDDPSPDGLDSSDGDFIRNLDYGPDLGRQSWRQLR